MNADELSDAIVERFLTRLGSSVIPSSFPAEVGEHIREACKHGARLSRHVIPMAGPMALFVEYRVNPDGTLNMELQDTNGCTFWRGTFRPVD